MPYVCGVFFLKRNQSTNGIIQDPNAFSEVIQLKHYITQKLSVSHNAEQWLLNDLCKPYCSLNEPIDIFYNLMPFAKNTINQSMIMPNTRLLLSLKHLTGSPMNLSYPVATVAGMQINIGFNFYGVTTDRRSGIMTDSEILAIWLRADKKSPEVEIILEKWELELLRFITEYNRKSINESHIRMIPLGDYMVNNQVMQGGFEAMPMLTCGIISLIIFFLIVLHFQGEKFSIPTMTICIAAVLSPLFASITALGFTLLLQIHINVMMLVIPFLILAVGVDDAFLLLGAWHHNKHRINRVLRLQSTFDQVAVSCTLTSLTNALAFGIGSTVPTPELRLFCGVAAAAITIDWVYQLSFFSAIMCLTATGIKAKEPIPENAVQTAVVLLEKPIEIKLDYADSDDSYSKILISYCNWITSWSLRVIGTLIWCLYLFGAITGIMNLKADMDPSTLVPRHSILAEALSIHELYIWKDYNPFVIIIETIPDNFTTKVEYDRFNAFLSALERHPHSLGRCGTLVWTRDYERYLKISDDITFGLSFDTSFYYDEYDDDLNETTGLNLRQFSTFLSMVQYSHWLDMIRFQQPDDTTSRIQAFSFIVAYKDLKSIGEVSETIFDVRKILADKGARYRAALFSPTAPLADVINSVAEVTTRSVLLTIGCMAIVCAIFIARVGTMILATIHVTSISAGVLGYLHWWGVTLDPITMVFTIMAVGFSVDYAAHYCHHYATCTKKTFRIQMRLAQTFQVIGYPMTFAGLSTLICMATVYWSPLPAFRVLLKTVILVVACGLLHGMFLLPISLGILSEFTDRGIRYMLGDDYYIGENMDSGTKNDSDIDDD